MAHSNGKRSGGDPEDFQPDDALPLDEVGRIVDLLLERGVGEIQVRKGELEITVKAREARAAAPHQSASSVPRSAGHQPETVETAAVPESNGLHTISSPIVGTFYRAPAPGEDSYVEVGDRVKAGQTLCIVEAMKLMNEIPADISGEVVEIIAENAKGVEYGQPLLRLRPES